METGERRINPVAMTFISLRKECLSNRAGLTSDLMFLSPVRYRLTYGARLYAKQIDRSIEAEGIFSDMSHSQANRGYMQLCGSGKFGLYEFLWLWRIGAIFISVALANLGYMQFCGPGKLGLYAFLWLWHIGASMALANWGYTHFCDSGKSGLYAFL